MVNIQHSIWPMIADSFDNDRFTSARYRPGIHRLHPRTRVRPTSVRPKDRIIVSCIVEDFGGTFISTRGALPTVPTTQKAHGHTLQDYACFRHDGPDRERERERERHRDRSRDTF